MNEEEAAKLAKKIKRCLTSIPNDVMVIVGSNQICVIDSDEYREHVTDPENAQVLAYECGSMKNVLGYEEWT